MLFLAPVHMRNLLPGLLNSRGLTGFAVEIGTHRGAYARQFLDHWKGERLYCVDPWAPIKGYEEQAESLKTIGSNGNREDDYNEAHGILATHGSRAKLLRMTSERAANIFKDRQVDFVYLDGDHRRRFVEQDLQLWWPLVRKGGILAGHDFLCPGEPDGLWGKNIQPAVLDFADRERVNVQLLIEENGQPWSYMLEKP